MLVGGVIALAGCGSSGDGGSPSTATRAAAPAPGTTPATTAAPATTSADGTCRRVAAPAPKGPQSLKAPTRRLDPDKATSVVFTTSCGRFTVRLDVREDPKTAASFAALARSGFYDDLTFHRVVPGFVVQGGDPNGDGTGDAGYQVTEAPPSDQTYTRGVVAMAKTATDPAGASSSQFFVTLADAGLPPEYAVAGRVTQGLEPPAGGGRSTVDAIAALGGEGADGPPSQPVVIESARVVSR